MVSCFQTRQCYRLQWCSCSTEAVLSSFDFKVTLLNKYLSTALSSTFPKVKETTSRMQALLRSPQHPCTTAMLYYNNTVISIYGRSHVFAHCTCLLTYFYLAGSQSFSSLSLKHIIILLCLLSSGIIDMYHQYRPSLCISEALTSNLSLLLQCRIFNVFCLISHYKIVLCSMRLCMNISPVVH